MFVTVLEAVLRGICKIQGWNYRQILSMATGKRPATAEVTAVFQAVLGVPPNVWPIRAVVVSRAANRYVRPVTEDERKAILRTNGRRRRVLGTAVHDVLDELDWSIADLTVNVSQILGKPVSRASMQFWATGTRQVGPRGKSYTHPVQAPLEVRIAAEKLTARAAHRRKLGEKAVLLRTAWPNVEAE